MKRSTQNRVALFCLLLSVLFLVLSLLFALPHMFYKKLPAEKLLSAAFPFLCEDKASLPLSFLTSAFPMLTANSSHSSGADRAAVLSPTPLPSSEANPVHEISITESDGEADADGIYLNNNTQKEVDVSALLALPSKIHIAPDAPTVLILHTHTSEAYTPTEKMNYTPTDTDRTEDPAFNMVRVGEELKNVLEESGISTVHDPTINDYPSYNGSYQKAYGRLQELLAAYPSVSVVIDLHRDALLYDDGSKMKVVWDSPEGKAAQAMLVVGTNDRLEHPDWQQNLSFALKLQAEMVASYPGLARPVNIAKHRYNQQVSHGAFILEMGASGNTLEEALLGVRYVGECLSRVLWAESEKNT